MTTWSTSATGCTWPIEPPRLFRRRRSRHLRELRLAAGALFDLRLAITGGVLALLVALSVVIFHAAMGLTWVNAIYFTVTTSATVGYGDFNLQSAPDWLKLYGSLFMILSAIGPVLVADGRYRDSLRALSVEGASAVIAATDDDLANLETALTARELNAEARIVVRLFDPELAARARAQLGLDACHSVPALAMPAFVAAALGEGVLSTFEHGSQLWVVAELWVRPGSRADGAATDSLERTGDLHVLAIRDSANERWRPGHPDLLEAGHQVLLAGTRDRWEQVRALTAS